MDVLMHIIDLAFVRIDYVYCKWYCTVHSIVQMRFAMHASDIVTLLMRLAMHRIL